MIPPEVIVENNELPDTPGVYFYYDRTGELLYVGKATSLKRRVGSYFTKAHERRIEELVSQIARIDYVQTPTVIEALVLEANQIKALRPKYNILQRDDKTFLYLVITNEPFPRPLLIRGHELEVMGVNPFQTTLSPVAKKKFLRVFGPYISGRSLKIALELVRKSIPWSDCQPPEITGRTRPCFNSQIDKCPGVCSGKISKQAYRTYIRQLILFFEGKKARLEREMEKEMEQASKALRFEEATVLRRRLGALQHIQDVALLSKEDHELPFKQTRPQEGIDLQGRIEAYDISNISGTSAVGSMVVFEEGKPAKAKYRKFKIKTVNGPNDVAMMEEVIRRRLKRAQTSPLSWSLPQVMVIDGGKPQVNRVQHILDELKIKVPIVGLAKGFDRKQDRLIFDRTNTDLARVVHRGKEVFQKARDEAHRFAVSYHRALRGRTLILSKKKKTSGRSLRAAEEIIDHE
ncbi:excinuclease ABC subunit UvrC [Candidatus Uhrbacteria bacterium]|nr:excinuclease ABC subunit UvrC [Candidatus Uhrbacteria bacterium]